jgi:hypothetical protein
MRSIGHDPTIEKASAQEIGTHYDIEQCPIIISSPDFRRNDYIYQVKAMIRTINLALCLKDAPKGWRSTKKGQYGGPSKARYGTHPRDRGLVKKEEKLPAICLSVEPDNR